MPPRERLRKILVLLDLREGGVFLSLLPAVVVVAGLTGGALGASATPCGLWGARKLARCYILNRKAA